MAKKTGCGKSMPIISKVCPCEIFVKEISALETAKPIFWDKSPSILFHPPPIKRLQ